MAISRRIYEDIQALPEIGLDGILEDGTQRPFWPNGFAIYFYAEVLLNKDLSFDEVKKDYFSHAYGERWKEVADCLEEISDLFDFAYMEGEKSTDPNRGKYYNPAHAKDLERVADAIEKERELAEECKNMPIRVQTVSMRLLARHAEYAEWLARIMKEKTVGNQDGAKEILAEFSIEFGKYEIELERYYDHFMVMKTLNIYMSEKTELN